MYNLSKLAAGSVFVAAAALGGASAVLADGYSPKGKVVYERPSDWSGVYFGVHSGYQWSSIDMAFPDFGTAASVDHGSEFVGAHLGIQHQWGVIVLGAEANLDMMFKNNPGATPCPNPALTCTARIDDILSVGGRVGYAAGHWMPYVTGGYATTSVEFKANNAAATTTEQGHTRNPGWYIGGGVEWIVSPGWTAGIEYRHYDFGDNTTQTWTTAAPQGVPVERLRTELTTESVTARVSWKFGREIAAPLK